MHLPRSSLPYPDAPLLHGPPSANGHNLSDAHDSAVTPCAGTSVNLMPSSTFRSAPAVSLVPTVSLRLDEDRDGTDDPKHGVSPEPPGLGPPAQISGIDGGRVGPLLQPFGSSSVPATPTLASPRVKPYHRLAQGINDVLIGCVNFTIVSRLYVPGLAYALVPLLSPGFLLEGMACESKKRRTVCPSDVDSEQSASDICCRRCL
jgi:hypothetical protein